MTGEEIGTRSWGCSSMLACMREVLGSIPVLQNCREREIQRKRRVGGREEGRQFE
jgi:hypothetical protein